MQMRVEVKDRQEADLLRRGLADPEVRAFVKVVGALSRLPSHHARGRVLRFVQDSVAEGIENG